MNGGRGVNIDDLVVGVLYLFLGFSLELIYWFYLLFGVIVIIEFSRWSRRVLNLGI